MEYKINKGAADVYAGKLTDYLALEFFSANKTHISGKEIVSFSKVEALNFLILRTLFARWKAETQKLESPFFNFNAPEVQDALGKFMNVVSGHILIEKDDFMPLVKQSVTGLIYLSLAPYHFMKEIYLKDLPHRFAIERMESDKKFIKVNAPLFHSWLQKITEQGGHVQITKEDALNALSEAYQKNLEKLETGNQVISQMSAIVPLTPEQLAINDKHPSQVTKPDIIGKDAGLPLFKKDDDSALAGNEIKKQVTLNDLLKNKENELSLLEKHQKNKILDIRSAISINQKFMFVKELFKNDEEAFAVALGELDSCHTYEEAINHLLEKYAGKYNWDTDKEEVSELFHLVSRRFGASTDY